MSKILVLIKRIFVLRKNILNISRNKAEKDFGIIIMSELFLNDRFEPIILFALNVGGYYIPIFHELNTFCLNTTLHEFKYILHHLI